MTFGGRARTLPTAMTMSLSQHTLAFRAVGTILRWKVRRPTALWTNMILIWVTRLRTQCRTRASASSPASLDLEMTQKICNTVLIIGISYIRAKSMPQNEAIVDNNAMVRSSTVQMTLMLRWLNSMPILVTMREARSRWLRLRETVMIRMERDLDRWAFWVKIYMRRHEIPLDCSRSIKVPSLWFS